MLYDHYVLGESIVQGSAIYVDCKRCIKEMKMLEYLFKGVQDLKSRKIDFFININSESVIFCEHLLESFVRKFE